MGDIRRNSEVRTADIFFDDKVSELKMSGVINMIYDEVARNFDVVDDDFVSFGIFNDGEVVTRSIIGTTNNRILREYIEDEIVNGYELLGLDKDKRYKLEIYIAVG